MEMPLAKSLHISVPNLLVIASNQFHVNYLSNMAYSCEYLISNLVRDLPLILVPTNDLNSIEQSPLLDPLQTGIN